jgi:spermidine synthase
MKLSDDWFTEIHEEGGNAFSLRIVARLYAEQTPYQCIEIFETTNFGRLMVIDGCVMLSSRDNFLYHEMMAHPVLYAHREPKNVLIVGGGDCGTLCEVLRHPEVESAVQVEIDERVTRLAEKYFPELCESNCDPRATLLFEDGIRWMRDAVLESLDVIIVDSTDPIGPAEGLFSESFYRDCLGALRPGGLIVQQSESPLLHMKILRNMHIALHAAGYADVKTLQFPQPVYPSGWWSATLARKGEMIDGLREQAVVEQPFTTQYYSADIHRAAFAMPPFFTEFLARGADV